MEHTLRVPSARENPSNDDQRRRDVYIRRWPNNACLPSAMQHPVFNHDEETKARDLLTGKNGKHKHITERFLGEWSSIRGPCYRAQVDEGPRNGSIGVRRRYMSGII